MDKTKTERRRSLGHPSLMERSLQRSTHEVSLSSFSFLFSEMVQYSLNAAKKGYRMEDRLHEMGLRIGYKVLELVAFRERAAKREIRIVSFLSFVASAVWRCLFGRSMELLRAQDTELEYMLNDKELLTNKFISPPRDLGHLNCGAFAAGIIEGLLCSAEFVRVRLVGWCCCCCGCWVCCCLCFDLAAAATAAAAALP
ncbi:transport protein particle component Bet3 domain-containing protein, putative [Eimeria tenella]|uniref:Transport protein particle component Bet3 domain-containing protein, putative n=1 Tax=Eimeria tenella TaxID=5802 RepID=U6KYV3_EIMTE|nr:transport protein particle component Bet3 domain-containing protein, putative [Eimeria tenella]CDJ43352.1 transport protein particle component Bet3 domain-containing protein, putative [Eimeria tenella]|eukprot:XP_013234102.1 transport protein particle component Bet3 domain-containing protein, putative [Eimeria tenella]